MKQNSLQYLLEKYREGTLNDEERGELERLTHKDEVMASANHRVTAIVRRRVSLAIAAVMVVGVGLMALLPRGMQQPLVAEVQEMPVVQEELPVVVEVMLPAVNSAPEKKAAVAKPKATRRDEPVVVCNSQCDADSVISVIRKFLSV